MPGNASVLPQVVYFGQPGLTVPGVNVRSFQEIKDSYFGTGDKDARLLAFHYMVFAPFQDFQPNYPNTPYSASISCGDRDFSRSESALIRVSLRLVNGSFMLVTSGRRNLGRPADYVARDQWRYRQCSIRSGLSFVFRRPALATRLLSSMAPPGLAEVAFAPSPDNNSLPGNDVIVSAGAMGVLQGSPRISAWRGRPHPTN